DNPHSELVMTPGMSILAANDQGSIRIDYIDKYTRKYSWDGYQRTFRHQARFERWYGSLGMYRPVGDGTMHVVLQEGQMHFSSTAEAEAWIKKQERHVDYVWTKDGLVIGWKQQPRPYDGYLFFTADVWQILINGKKPVLNGAAPSK